jgi:hypothetical protein
MVVANFGMATIQTLFFIALAIFWHGYKPNILIFTMFWHCPDFAIAKFWLGMLGQQTKRALRLLYPSSALSSKTKA